VTGKLPSQGGISGRTEASGLGMVQVLKELLQDEDFLDECEVGPGIKGKKVIIEGFGSVGYHFAKYVRREGAKVIAIIERDASLYSENGLDVDEVKMHMQKTGSLKDFPYAD
jgi:glutamate dehydrogenase (NAD(P)+)